MRNKAKADLKLADSFSALILCVPFAFKRKSLLHVRVQSLSWLTLHSYYIIAKRCCQISQVLFLSHCISSICGSWKHPRDRGREEHAQWSSKDVRPGHWQAKQIESLSGMMGVRRNGIRVYEPRLPFPTLQRKKTNIHGKRWCFPSGLLQMSLSGPIPSWIIKRTADSSVPRKLPAIHCRHRVPLLLRKAQTEAIASASVTLMSPTPEKNGVSGRIPNERGPFSFTFSMKSSVHYLLKSQLDNFLIKQVSIRYTESSLHDYQHLLEHSFQWWVNQPAVCGFPVNSVWCLFNKCWSFCLLVSKEEE